MACIDPRLFLPQDNVQTQKMSQLSRDPWAKREAWRKHPIFSYSYYYRNMFPGLGLGVTAFVAYCVWEKYAKKPASHGAH